MSAQVPVYKSMNDAMTRHADADVLINFASLRSAYESSLEALKYPQIRTIAIIAEGKAFRALGMYQTY